MKYLIPFFSFIILITLIAIPLTNCGCASNSDTVTQIAFSSNRDGDYDIYTVKSDGSGLLQLTDDSATDMAPDWSPDGKKIAFSSNRSGNFEIYTMNTDGSGVKQLTNDGIDKGAPAWSPDGKKIAFMWGNGLEAEIFLTNSDGTGIVR
ncbi:MAG: PD40 domain-containing protein, partial [Dehalococcoidia bacterium]